LSTPPKSAAGQGAEPRKVAFGEFVLDLDRGTLLNKDADVPLGPKCFEVLCYLVEHHCVLLSKDEILAAVWADVIVTDDSLTHCLIEIRKALGDETKEMVRTLPRRGYLFDVPVRTHEPGALYSAAILDTSSDTASITLPEGDLYYGNYPGQVDETRRMRSTDAGFGGMNGTNMYKFVEAVDNNVCMQSTFPDPHATEFFSFTLYDTDGYLMDGNMVINSRDMVSNSDGTYTVSINCGDDAINNISAPDDVDTIGYACRVYGASEEVENRSWDPIDTMKVVTGADVIKP